MASSSSISCPDDLVQMFQSITTTDHDKLISQFAKVLRIDDQTANFFLESSNWNVETAVNNYLAAFANSEPIEAVTYIKQTPEAAFISDLSGTHSLTFLPKQKINMRWSFCNTGALPWPQDTQLIFADGQSFGGPQALSVEAIPGGQCDVAVILETPQQSGTYAGHWRLACATGYFGDPIWVILNVDENKVARPEAGDATMLNFDALALSSTAGTTGNQPKPPMNPVSETDLDEDMDI